jgi:DNA-binding MarR family transcriptional regulator
VPKSLTLEEQIVAALRRITRAIDLRSRTLLHDYGLTAPQLAVLKAVERLQPITPGSLAREIHLGHPTVTGILNRLETRGLILRTRGNQDRRSVNVALTETGRQILSNAPNPLHEQFLAELTKLQSWEQTQMLATLQRIADMMDAGHLAAAPLLSSPTTEAVLSDSPLHLEERGDFPPVDEGSSGNLPRVPPSPAPTHHLE